MILTRPGNEKQQEIADKANVRELLEFERFCRDNALWTEMEGCYAKESRVEVSWFQGSGTEFVAASKQMKSRAPHKIFETHIWVNSDRAASEISSDSFLEFRESYACLSYVLNKAGYQIHSELPGIDRPELVELMYQQADYWLCE